MRHQPHSGRKRYQLFRQITDKASNTNVSSCLTIRCFQRLSRLLPSPQQAASKPAEICLQAPKKGNPRLCQELLSTLCPTKIQEKNEMLVCRHFIPRPLPLPFSNTPVPRIPTGCSGHFRFAFSASYISFSRKGYGQVS